ncbi:MAG TPA: hypothetical protein PLY73_16950, partial [Candidatus Ozemobacteraceae bacterium]|nr:hypothetical protein [Candidatus Ozemobacteraceae bacterium]
MSWRAYCTDFLHRARARSLVVFLVLATLMLCSGALHAQAGNPANPRAKIDVEDRTRVEKIEPADTPFPIPRIRVDIDPSRERGQIGTGLQVLLLLTILSLAPSILIMLTSFTRILIVLNFVRRALTTQQEPSNQILIGLALFITF